MGRNPAWCCAQAPRRTLAPAPLSLVALGAMGRRRICERVAGGGGGVMGGWSTGALAPDCAYELRGPFFPRGACAPGRRTLRTAVGNEKKHHAVLVRFFPFDVRVRGTSGKSTDLREVQRRAHLHVFFFAGFNAERRSPGGACISFARLFHGRYCFGWDSRRAIVFLAGIVGDPRAV